jgi:hypothetical protein
LINHNSYQKINLLEILFGDIKDRIKEIIKTIKDKFRKPEPTQTTIVVHQFPDYNNIEE